MDQVMLLASTPHTEGTEVNNVAFEVFESSWVSRSTETYALPRHHDTAGSIAAPSHLDGIITDQSKVTSPPPSLARIFATLGCPLTIRHCEKEVSSRKHNSVISQILTY